MAQSSISVLKSKPGLRQHLLGLFRVVVIGLDGVVVTPDGGRERVLGRDGQPRENGLDQGLLVDGVAERLAHPGVLQPGLFGVEREVAHVHARPLDDRDLRVLLDQADGIRVEVVGDVHRAGLQGHQARRGLGDGLENDLVHLGLLAPVVVVAFEHDLVVLGPAHEFEGPGAHRVLADLVLVLGHGLGREDRAEPERQVVQQRGVGFFGDQGDGIVVDDLDLLHRPERHAGVFPLAVTVEGCFLKTTRANES